MNLEKIMCEYIAPAIAPVIIPTPYVGKYKTIFEIADGEIFLLLTICDNKQNKKVMLVNDSGAIRKYILESIFNFQESIIIYNDISHEMLFDMKYWNLKITVKQGNQQFVCDYSTDNKINFINYIMDYSELAKLNNMIGLSNELKEIIGNFDEKSQYKFKTKRKSILG